jgi:hypothetical protein
VPGRAIMAQVFVSSTFTDLQDYRQAVRQSLMRLGHIDMAMEYYVAEDQLPLAKSLADVEACDLYILVLA